jgi:hypothetical protein
MVRPEIARRPESPAWDRRVGSRWASILDPRGLRRTGAAVEVAPGFSAKVGYGLRQRRFRGSLFVVEPSSEARDWVCERYRGLIPAAEVIPVGHPLASAAERLPRRVDALLMNHGLDDLVLSAALPPGERERVFGQMRPGVPCQDEVRRVWRLLRTDAHVFTALTDRILSELLALCAAVNPRLLGLSQYPSWFQAQNGLDFVDGMIAPLLRELARRLAGAGKASVQIVGHGQDEPRWLVARWRPAKRRNERAHAR